MKMEIYKNLVLKALEAQKMSYSPYSEFEVGAALLAKNGKIYTGCNIENTVRTAKICAERTAFFKAVSEGVLEFEAIAVVGGFKISGNENRNFYFPCNECLEVMSEFCKPDTFKIILAKNENEIKEHFLKDMLPFSFTVKDV